MSRLLSLILWIAAAAQASAGSPAEQLRALGEKAKSQLVAVSYLYLDEGYDDYGTFLTTAKRGDTIIVYVPALDECLLIGSEEIAKWETAGPAAAKAKPDIRTRKALGERWEIARARALATEGCVGPAAFDGYRLILDRCDITPATADKPDLHAAFKCTDRDTGKSSILVIEKATGLLVEQQGKPNFRLLKKREVPKLDLSKAGYGVEDPLLAKP